MEMQKNNKKRFIGLAIAVILILIGALTAAPSGLEQTGWVGLMILLGSLVMMFTDTMPLACVSFVGLALLAWFKVTDWGWIFGNFGLSSALFMVGAFSTTAALVNTSIPVRIANFAMKLSKGNTKLLVLYFMIFSAIVSSFMSNMAAMGVFVGVALKAIALLNDPKPGSSNLARDLMIGVALGSGIGGVGTPCGFGGNLAIIGMIESSTGIKVSFMQWTIIGYPIMIITLVVAWIILINVFKPEPLPEKSDLAGAADKLPPLDAREIKAVIIMVLMIACWILGSWYPVLNGIAVALVGTALFMMPGIDVFTWPQFNKEVSWNMVFMCGGIIPMITAVSGTGAIKWVVDGCLGVLSGMPLIILLFCMALLGALLHSFIPLGAPIMTLLTIPYCLFGVSLGFSPVLGAIIAAFFSTAAVNLPYDALPAMGLAYGYFSAGDYVKQGIPTAIACCIILALIGYPLCSLVF